MLLLDQVLVYGDCVVNFDFLVSDLVEIVVQSVVLVQVFGILVWVVMISYFIGDFGFGVDVDKVCEVICLVCEQCFDLLIDGFLQYDVVVIVSVGCQKVLNSLVVGQVMVFIFFDLNIGNIIYKVVQCSVDCVSVGLML